MKMNNFGAAQTRPIPAEYITNYEEQLESIKGETYIVTPSLECILGCILLWATDIFTS